jgi:hypothetical protein
LCLYMEIIIVNPEKPVHIFNRTLVSSFHSGIVISFGDMQQPSEIITANAVKQRIM